MRFLIIAVLALTGANAFALRDQVLTKNEAESVRQEIDNICGDSWCEGDFNFSFKEFDCYKTVAGATCELSFDMILTDFVDSTDEKMEISLQRFYPAKCTFHGMKREEIISGDKKDGYSYGEVLYEKVSECISQLEERVAKIEANLNKGRK